MGRIHRFVFVFCILVMIVGILKVNIEFNRLNGNANNKKNYEGIYRSNRKYCDAFGEVTINRKTGNKLKIYINYRPIDIRFNVGKKVLYINGSVFEQLKKDIESIVSRI